MAIGVVVHGAAGRMGTEVLSALCRDQETKAVGAVDVAAKQDALSLPGNSGSIPYSTDLQSILDRCRPDVMVDFSIRDAAMPAVRIAAKKGVSLVIGTTGLSEEDGKEIEALCYSSNIGAIIAPNFCLGAVLMTHLAALAARYFDTVEVIEKHHDGKADAPSGTAMATAQAMIEGRGKPFKYPALEKETLRGTRGGETSGIAIHSVRLPGLLAHQEVIFGAPGQTLTIRQDSISRESFMPGVLMAVKEVARRKGFTYGLEGILGL